VILCPARFDPTFSLRPWGARSLAPLFPAKTNLAEPIGEAWMTGNESRFVDGPFAGRTLGEVWPAMPAEWAGTDADRNAAFPLLVKFIFAEEKLSVQVHPNDAYAAQHENGGRGKTEMWYILRSQPGAEVLAGLKPDVTRDSFRAMIENGTAENALVHVPLRAGDAVFVPAGTAHTIGAGLMLCEIQEQSDTTYRVYDYNRRDAQGHSRELHVEKALEVMRFGKQEGGKLQPVRIHRDGVAKTFFIACDHFATEKWEFARAASATTSPAHFELLIFLGGEGEIRWPASAAAYAPSPNATAEMSPMDAAAIGSANAAKPQSVRYSPAQAWMLPAALGAYELVASSPTSLLRTWVPKNLSEAANYLADQGVAESDRSRLLYSER
jgi:mannose-6-phosphate isomerase